MDKYIYGVKIILKNNKPKMQGNGYLWVRGKGVP